MVLAPCAESGVEAKRRGEGHKDSNDQKDTKDSKGIKDDDE